MKIQNLFTTCFLLVIFFYSCKNNEKESSSKIGISKISIDKTSVVTDGKIEELLDQKQGTDQGGWVGFNTAILEGKIDLGHTDTVDVISMQFLNDSTKQIFPPKYVSLFFSFNDVDYNELPAFLVKCGDEKVCKFSVPAAGTKMRFVKFKIENSLENKKVMIDEISLN
jgi:hypothetical protein